ncbi:hypothetical protein KJZ99_07020 [bacterium]|nr:hypothetical protein [bacterium]
MNKFLGAVVTLMLVASLWPRTEVTRYDLPLVTAGASEEREEEIKTASASSGDTTAGLPWLHVVVETKYAWIYQKSIGKAWTTASRDDSTRVPVGKLCMKLEAYKKHEVCWADTSYIELEDMKRRVAVKKRKAVVTAWAENPSLARTSVEMMP